jgi:hypothetical protein
MSASMEDSQRVQRDAFGYVERELRGHHGFQIEGGLFCRRDPDPFDTMFRENIELLTTGSQVEHDTPAFLARFRQKPVSFLIASHMRPSFPAAVHRFWEENYQR